MNSYESFLGELSAKWREEIRKHAKRANFKPSEPLYLAKDLNEFVIFVHEGTCELVFKEGTRALTKIKVPPMDAPDIFGEFSVEAPDFSYYDVHARTFVVTTKVPKTIILKALRKCRRARHRFETLLEKRTQLVNDPVLSHNIRLLTHYLSNTRFVVANSVFGILKLVAFPMLRLHTEFLDGDNPCHKHKNVILIGTHHVEFDGVLSAIACTDLKSWKRSAPYYVVNDRFWLSNQFIETFGVLSRNLVIRVGTTRKTNQYGFEILKAIFKRKGPKTAFLYPWGRTPADAVALGESLALDWVIENLDCHIVPFAMSGFKQNVVLELLMLPIRPIRWKMGAAVRTKDLLKVHGSAAAARDFLAEKLSELSRQV